MGTCAPGSRIPLRACLLTHLQDDFEVELAPDRKATVAAVRDGRFERSRLCARARCST